MKNAVSIKNLTLQAGDFNLGAIDLDLAEKEYFVLMGATGSGKSLLLKALCGLHPIKSGNIVLSGKDVTALPPRLRKIAYVPQNSGLFPHLNVIRNISFSLEVGGMSFKKAKHAIEEIVTLLGIEDLLERAPSTLSGGERQKVALARTLVMKPNVLLLDEPVSAVDEPTRKEICNDLIQVKDRIGIATIHVCHSKEEAACVADSVAVMHDGKIISRGTMDELCRQHENPVIKRLLDL